MVEFPTGVNKKILRNGTNWAGISAVKEDKTRSGKTKRMLYASQMKKPFSVKMHFSYSEYLLFKDWYENTCYNGLNSFAFPAIDIFASIKPEKEYRFVAGSAPQYLNPTGKIIECTMQWEEV